VFSSQLLYNVATVDLNTLVAELMSLPKGGGELIFGNGLDDPYPACCEAVLGL
jgi:hypothetical protein